ncbi:MAG TPA: hypothetical protein VEB22_10490 [Phycisphaerales bacterium]|nr:hypothetical protein [Phycisphaerales bacterium]
MIKGLLGVCLVCAALGGWVGLRCHTVFRQSSVTDVRIASTATHAYTDIAAVWWVPDRASSRGLNARGPACVVEFPGADRVFLTPGKGFSEVELRRFGEAVAARSGRTLLLPADLITR